MTINDFKSDIQSGKIKKLAMLECTVKVIKDDEFMYEVIRDISGVYDDHFTLSTYCKDGSIIDLEAYYNAFTTYTGNSVSNDNVFYAII